MRLWLMAVFVVLASTVLPAATVAFSRLDCPVDVVCLPTAINSNGTITGQYRLRDEPPGVARPFLLKNGVFERLQISSQIPDSAGVSSMNSQEWLVGFALPSAFVCEAPLETLGRICSTFNIPGASRTWAGAINNAGDIAGYATSPSGGYGFLLRDGRFTKIKPPGAVGANAYGINNLGEIVGVAQDHPFQPGVPLEQYGFIYTNGTYTKIVYPGASETNPQSINDLGWVLGTYWSGNGPRRGFVYIDQQFTSIDYPGSIGTFIIGLNNLGQFLGTATSDGEYVTYIGQISR